MTNADEYRTLTLQGKVSARAATFANKDDANKRTQFQITEPKCTRTRRTDGEKYETSDRWTLSVFVNEDDPESQSTNAQINDLDIGDEVEVKVAVVSRKGYPQFDLVSLRNNAQ